MSFRRRLLLMFALTVVISVAAVAVIVSYMARRAFDRANDERSAALVAQFRREFNRRGEDVARRVQTIAADPETSRMALAASKPTPDYSAYLDDAQVMAEAQRLDFLEIADDRGTIISSAQWPAKFGYKEPLANAKAPTVPFLKEALVRQRRFGQVDPDHLIARVHVSGISRLHRAAPGGCARRRLIGALRLEVLDAIGDRWVVVADLSDVAPLAGQGHRAGVQREARGVLPLGRRDAAVEAELAGALGDHVRESHDGREVVLDQVGDEHSVGPQNTSTVTENASRVAHSQMWART